MMLINPYWYDPAGTIDHFAATGANFPNFGNATYPASFYDSATTTTWFVWESYHNSARYVQVTTYNHTTGKWSDIVDVALNPLVDDSHGVPAICMDHQGYVHCFYGPHDGDMLHSVTVSPNDPSEWRFQQTLAGRYTYPHPVLVGSTLYLFTREKDAATSNRWGVRFKTTSLSGGVATFGARQQIVNFVDAGASRFYSGVHNVVGTDIHFTANWSDASHTTSRHVYHFVYDTADDSIRNADSSVDTVVASQPISYATANTSYRVVDFGTDLGDRPAFCIDSSGNLHIVYARGTTDPATLYHVVFSGGAWGTPVAIGTIDGVGISYYHDSLSLVPLAGGVVHLYYINNKQSWTWGGDVKRRVYSGTWGSETTILAAGVKPLMRCSAVLGAHADARVMFSETIQNELDSSAGGLKVYAYGDSGFLQRVPQVPTDIILSSTKVVAGASVGTVIGQLQAVDTDYLDTFTWTITADPDSKFQITGNELATNAAISYPNSHNVTIRCTDSYGLTRDEPFTIVVVQTQAELNDTYYGNALLLLDSQQPGSGTDPSIANVILLLDGS